MDLGTADELGDRFTTLFAADDIDDLRADLCERLGDVPCDAFLIRDAKDEQRFAGELKEVVHRRFQAASALASVTAKLSVTAGLPSQVTLAERKKASPRRSSSTDSTMIVSPGRIIRLNLTSFSRPATGTPSPLGCLLSRTAPACMAASQSITPGTIGKLG